MKYQLNGGVNTATKTRYTINFISQEKHFAMHPSSCHCTNSTPCATYSRFLANEIHVYYFCINITKQEKPILSISRNERQASKRYYSRTNAINEKALASKLTPQMVSNSWRSLKLIKFAQNDYEWCQVKNKEDYSLKKKRWKKKAKYDITRKKKYCSMVRRKPL